MKKLFALILVLMLGAMMVQTMTAEDMVAGTEAAPDFPLPSDWADADHAQVTVQLFPARGLGTGYADDDLALYLHWAESGQTVLDYVLVMEKETADEKTAVYAYRGDIAERTCDRDGSLMEEKWLNREARGTAFITADQEDDLLLRFEDAAEERLNSLLLRPVTAPAPSVREIADRVLQPLYSLEQGTAGSSLARVQAAADLIRFAADSRLYAVDYREMKTCMVDALESMQWSDEQYFDVYSANENAVTDLMNTLAGLTDPDGPAYEAARSLAQDAGVWDDIADSLASYLDCCSVEVLTAQLATIENMPED